jgi:hypothetical protein
MVQGERLIGMDAFSQTGHTRCAMYLWAALQTHRVLQGYIELDFIAHPEVCSVVVEHYIQTRVPMAMHYVVKADAKDLKVQVKTSIATVKKLELKLGRQTNDIAKLQQEMKMALKK